MSSNEWSDPDNCGQPDPLTIENDQDASVPHTHPHPTGKGVLAIDMDDVLCCASGGVLGVVAELTASALSFPGRIAQLTYSNTNQTIVDMHHHLFNVSPPIMLEEFHHYLYWHNRGWGNQTETVEMVSQLYRHGLMDRPKPVPGAKEGLQKLKEMGYTLIIITARSESQREGTEAWLAEHLPDIFDEIHFTGAFNHLIPATKEEHEGHAAKRAVVSHKKRTKHEVMMQTNALLLVDDSAENAMTCACLQPAKTVLLFGSYPWNAEVRPPHVEPHPDESKTYVELEAEGKLYEARERRRQRIEHGWLPEGVMRVKDWEAVVEFVRGLDK